MSRVIHRNLLNACESWDGMTPLILFHIAVWSKNFVLLFLLLNLKIEKKRHNIPRVALYCSGSLDMSLSFRFSTVSLTIDL